MLRSAWSNRAFHVIVADPGAGKTTSIRDLRKTAGGRSILAITTPKNNEEEQALGDQLYTALGLPGLRTLAHPQAAPSWDTFTNMGQSSSW
jgi:hypothetical protein